VIVRSEAPGDVEQVARVVSAAFGRPDEAPLVESFAASRAYSLVAVSDWQVIGHVMFSPVAVEEEAAGVRAVGLALAVDPEQQSGGARRCK
jgi:putative acetyltransferase